MPNNHTEVSTSSMEDNLAQANSEQFGVPADRLPRLYQIALKVLHNPADAADAVQQGLLLAYAKRDQFRGQSKFTSWVTRIVINSALMHRRRQKCARPTVSLEAVPDGQVFSMGERIPDPGPNPEQWYADKELYERLGSYLQSLSPVRRITFLLRAVQGLSTRETARTLRVSENAVKSNYLHSRRQLAALFRNELRPSQ